MKILSPRLLLRAEGAAALAASCVLYQRAHGSWLWFALLLLAPDVSMVGYLFGRRPGAMAYNLVHTYVAPLVFLGLLEFTGHTALLWQGLIWTAHIGMDRLLGFGLKYETEFKDTHLNRV